LGDHHAVIEDPRLEHGTHAATQDLDRHAFSPRTEGLALIVEHANQALGQVGGVGGFYVDRGFAHQARVRQTQVGKVSLAARAARGFGNVQAKGCIRLVHGFLRSIL